MMVSQDVTVKLGASLRMGKSLPAVLLTALLLRLGVPAMWLVRVRAE